MNSTSNKKGKKTVTGFNPSLGFLDDFSQIFCLELEGLLGNKLTTREQLVFLLATDLNYSLPELSDAVVAKLEKHLLELVAADGELDAEENFLASVIGILKLNQSGILQR